MLAAALAAALAVAHAADGYRQPTRPPWLPAVWWRIALCETGGNWRHATRDYVSAFGIHRGSWAAFRPAWVPARAEAATPRQQYAVALAIWRRYSFSGWGCRP